ncbi:MAG: hypothetical protein AAGC55_30420, partial [Myxococcota bacterium]
MDDSRPQESETRAAPSGPVGLAEVMESSQDCDYNKVGYHHHHVTTPNRLLDVARSFRAAGYILEMVTCQDRREDLAAMRLVYTFNHLGQVDRHLVHADVAVSVG